MPWYAYHRGGWQIAVDALNRRDASKFMAHEVPDAIYDGEFTPPSSAHPSMASAFVTYERQRQISANIRRQDEQIRRENPWLGQDKESQ